MCWCFVHYWDNPNSPVSSCELLHSSHCIAAFTASSLVGVHTDHRWPALTYATGATFHITQMLLQSSQYIWVEINSVYCCILVPVWLIHTHLCQDTQCVLLCTVPVWLLHKLRVNSTSQHLSYAYSMITQSQLNFAVYYVSVVQQTTCFIIITKLLRSMLRHMIVTVILNTKHLKTHAVSLSLRLFI